MIFDRAARFITRRYKLIISVWVIALAASSLLYGPSQAVISGQEIAPTSSNQESDIAKSIIDSNFGSATSPSLFLVVSTGNVTSPGVRGFAQAISSAAKSDPGLSNVTSVDTVYSTVSGLVDGAVTAARSVRNATELTSNLIFGVPSAFVKVWNSSYGMDPQKIQPAEAATAALLSGATGGSQAALSSQYLKSFATALQSTYTSNPSATVNERLASTLNLTASELIDTALPASSRDFSLRVLHSFTLAEHADPGTIESFVANQTASSTLFTPTFVKSVYPLIDSNATEASVLQSIVVDPSGRGVPAVYRSAVASFVSPDHRVMLIVLNLKGVADSDVAELRSLVQKIAPSYGLASSVLVTGNQAISHDFAASSFADVGLILPVTIIILVAATGIFFRSVITPIASLFTIGVALGIAQSVIIYAVGTFVVGVDSNVPNILLTVLIGVGTDYSVFLLARYREERVKGRDKVQAVQNSVAWAGESIATSGLTVIISFLFLGIFQNVPLLRSLGLVVGPGVLVALAVSLTLVPSLILLAPARVFWPNTGARFERYAAAVKATLTNKTGYFSKASRLSIKHGKVVVLLALVVTVPSVYVWSTLPVGYDFLAAAPKGLESVSAFNTMVQGFGGGTVYPTYAVLQFRAPLWNGSSYDASELRLVDTVSNATLSQGNVDTVTGPTRPGGERIGYLNLGNDTRSRLLEGSINSMVSRDGKYALLTIDLKASPQSQASLATAQNLRASYRSIVQDNPQSLAAVYLGGAAGSTLDSKESVSSQFNQVILYVMLGVAAVLLVVLGSVFLPLFAIASIVMSIAWTLAATDILFQQLYNFPILYITPLTLFVLLLGLGMDYNIFILTRIREEASKGAKLDDAITTSIENTGGVITAAAIILAGSLGALALSSNLLLKEFGFAFFFSILVDALIMRTYIVPSVMSMMGKWNWWAPGRLQRIRIKEEKR